MEHTQLDHLILKPLNITVQQWNALLVKCPQANWMNSWGYTKAARARDYKTFRLFEIVLPQNTNLDKTNASNSSTDQSKTESFHLNNDFSLGVLMVYEIRWGFIQYTEILRGPLWFENTLKKFSLNDLTYFFLKAFQKEFLSQSFSSSGFLSKGFFKFFKWRRLLIEHVFSSIEQAQNSKHFIEAVQKLGFKLKPQEFTTALIDLTVSEEELRKNLHQKWRNLLNNAEKRNLKIEVDQKSLRLKYFLLHYDLFKKNKKFDGPSSLFLKEEFLALLPFKQSYLLWAFKNDSDSKFEKPLAGLYMCISGLTATYRVSFNTEEGRSEKAHYQLLWQALLVAKASGCHKFDVGGLLPEKFVNGAPQVDHFKLGLGAKPQYYLGVFS